MKQHALTHKTPGGTTPTSRPSSNSGDSTGTPTTSAAPGGCGITPTSFGGSPSLLRHLDTGNRSDCSDAGNMSDSSNVDMRMEASAASLKRSPPESEAVLPMPKRPHGKSKMDVSA